MKKILYFIIPLIGFILFKNNVFADSIDFTSYTSSVLFENSSGTTSDVTLSDSAANYDFIVIEFGRYNSNYAQLRNGETSTLSFQTIHEDNLGFYASIITVSGTSIKRGSSVISWVLSSGKVTSVNQNQLSIFRVVGFKKEDHNYNLSSCNNNCSSSSDNNSNDDSNSENYENLSVTTTAVTYLSSTTQKIIKNNMFKFYISTLTVTILILVIKKYFWRRV